MIRCTLAATIRGASRTLCVAGVVLSAISCRDDSIVGPTDPATNKEADPLLAAATSAPLTFAQVSAGNDHTCGVTTDNRLYCWGYNASGQVGDGTTTNRLRPVAVATGLQFREVSAGTYATCALTTGYRAYCWGANGYGNLGDGTTIDHSSPVAVAGGRQFRQLATYGWHTCAVGFADARAYCWGLNGEGQIGDGSQTQRLVPVAVAGSLHFRQVTTGGTHTCGLTPENQAYCWGDNRAGQIGDRTEVRRRQRPVAVADGHHFLQLDAGEAHTCAVATDARAFCWGNGRGGQLGNGKAYLSFWPRAVSGGLSFVGVTAGLSHSCGVTTANRAYCWGTNGAMGMLGDGTTTTRLTPVAVAGGHSFVQVSAGDFHTCAKTGAGAAYCWGDNPFGELGDGTTQERHTPVAVVGP